jgi:hypothetical protein
MIQTGQIPTRPEMAAYEAALPNLLPRHEGEFVVIKGNSLIKYFNRYEAALEWAYEQFGLDAFFVKKVTSVELSTVHLTRDLGPCRS